MSKEEFLAAVTGHNADLRLAIEALQATDPIRRSTKRAKDRLDRARLSERHPQALAWIPVGLIPEVDELRPHSG